MIPRASPCRSAITGTAALALPALARAAHDGGEAAAAEAVLEFDTALLLVALVCLGFLARAVADLNRQIRQLVAGREMARTNPLAATSPRPVAAASVDATPSPQVVAAITAAAFAVIQRPIRIVTVDDITSDHQHTWSLEGRRQIFSSHHVR